MNINVARRISTVCISGARRRNEKQEVNMAEVVVVVVVEVVKFMLEKCSCMKV